MEGVTGRRSRWDTGTSGTILSPEYVAEFIRDDDRMAAIGEAQ